MSEEKIFQISLAVIADIHGNRCALEAVLQDIDRRGIQQIIIAEIHTRTTHSNSLELATYLTNNNRDWV